MAWPRSRSLAVKISGSSPTNAIRTCPCERRCWTALRAPPTLSSMDSPPTRPGRAESPGVVVSAIDARALASRGIAREIDGDREGARTDLEAALALETDAARRAALERLLRFLDAPR